MSAELPTSPRFTDGQQLTPRRLEGLRRDTHRVAEDVGRNFRPPSRPRAGLPPFPDSFIGVVRTGGPNGEADYADARYWVDRAVPRQSLAVGDLFDTSVETIPNVAETVTATNLAELPTGASSASSSSGSGGTGGAGTHGVVAGTRVQVYRFRTRETDGPAGVDQYVFTWGGGLPSGGQPRMVLQRDDNLNAVWEWVETP